MQGDLAEAKTIISRFLQYNRKVPDRIGGLDPQAVVDAWIGRGEPIRGKVIEFELEWLEG